MICVPIRAKERWLADPEKYRKKHALWVANNPEKAKEYFKRWYVKDITTISDRYVKTRIGIKDAPQEVIELARLNLTLKREVRNGNQIGK